MIDTATRFAIDDLYANYAAALDDRRYDDWLGLFAEDCSYIVQPRENFDAGLPLATIRLESRGMIADRIRGITETLYHAPYYQRHLISGIRITVSGTALAVTANYLVVRTHANQPSDLFNAGRYEDLLVLSGCTWRFRSKRAVFDSELIPNSLIYPI